MLEMTGNYPKILKEIKFADKDLESIKYIVQYQYMQNPSLYDWFVSHAIYYNKHERYGYVTEHYHLKFNDIFMLNDWDMYYLVKYILGSKVERFVSHDHGRPHIFTDEDIINELVEQLKGLIREWISDVVTSLEK